MIEIFLAVSTFLVFLIIAAASFRLCKIRHVMDALVCVYLAVYLLSVILISLFMDSVNFWKFSIFLSFFFLIFVQSFAVFYKAVSLRIIWDICTSHEDRDTLENVVENSLVANTFARRIRGLEDAGLISIHGDQLAFTPKGFKMTRRILAVQKALGIENSG